MDLHRRLKEESHITFNRQYLSRLAEGGYIPFTTDNKGKKVCTITPPTPSPQNRKKLKAKTKQNKMK